MEYQPKIELTETLERARRGDQNASQELLTHHCKVWTYEELQALNCYRKLKDGLNTERLHSSSTYYVKKDFQSKPELVTVKWFQMLSEDYILYSLLFADETNQLWVGMTKPICNVTDWSNRDVQEEGKPKTKKEKRLSKVFIKPKQQLWNRRG
jgi:hypothetical protein